MKVQIMKYGKELTHILNTEGFLHTKEKIFSNTSFHLRIDGAHKKDRNKAEMKECKKTTGHLMEL